MWKQTIWREVTHLLYLALCCSTEPVGKLCDDGGDKWRRDARHKWTGSTGLERCRWLVISVSPSSAPRISCCVIKTDANCVFFLCVCGCVCVFIRVCIQLGGDGHHHFSLFFSPPSAILSLKPLWLCPAGFPDQAHNTEPSDIAAWPEKYENIQKAEGK